MNVAVSFSINLCAEVFQIPGKVFQKSTEFKVFATKLIFHVINVKISNTIILFLSHF